MSGDALSPDDPNRDTLAALADPVADHLVEMYEGNPDAWDELKARRPVWAWRDETLAERAVETLTQLPSPIIPGQVPTYDIPALARMAERDALARLGHPENYEDRMNALARLAGV